MSERLDRLARIMAEGIEHGHRPDEGHVEDLINLAPELIAVARAVEWRNDDRPPARECQICMAWSVGVPIPHTDDCPMVALNAKAAEVLP